MAAVASIAYCPKCNKLYSGTPESHESGCKANTPREGE